MSLLSKRARTDEYKVLELVFWLGQASRQHLMQLTDWSKSKVISLVSGLMEAGWLIESTALESTGGRRASGLTLNPERGYLLGFDLGVTSLDVGLYDLSLRCIDTRSVPVARIDDTEAVLESMHALAVSLRETWRLEKTDILAVGVGVPGPVDVASGMLVDPPIMPNWNRVSIPDEFAKYTPAPVYVDNDVNIMALGELHRRRLASGNGTAPLNLGNENFIVVKLGTGIGAGIVTHGELHRGADGAAGDIGHIMVDPSGPHCHCGNVGCLEAYAGAEALNQQAAQGDSEHFTRLLAKKGSLDSYDVAAAARSGDRHANSIIREAGQRIGLVLSGLTNFFNPGSIYLGGGISDISPSLLASVRQTVYARSLALSTRNLSIDLLPEKHSAGMRGACTLAFLGAARTETLL
jgi:predicted NBD/HSP70 family sugar kinase